MQQILYHCTGLLLPITLQQTPKVIAIQKKTPYITESKCTAENQKHIIILMLVAYIASEFKAEHKHLITNIVKVKHKKKLCP